MKYEGEEIKVETIRWDKMVETFIRNIIVKVKIIKLTIEIVKILIVIFHKPFYRRNRCNHID